MSYHVLPTALHLNRNITVQLLTRIMPTDQKTCSRCGSTHTVKAGKSHNHANRQIIYCHGCNRSFVSVERRLQ